MRGFEEIKGHNIRLIYDRDRADFIVKVEPHLFVVRNPETDAESEHNGANGKVPTRRERC